MISKKVHNIANNLEIRSVLSKDDQSVFNDARSLFEQGCESMNMVDVEDCMKQMVALTLNLMGFYATSNNQYSRQRFNNSDASHSLEKKSHVRNFKTI